ncbi:BRO family protein [Janthinobacterium lividum]
MQELKFNGRNFSLIERDGRVWLTATDIATALGYSRSDQVSRIYLRHEREFSKEMTAVVENTTLGHVNLSTEARIFSLRGAHLIGMFARTANGQAFRAWVLDQLDEADRRAAPARSLMAAWFKAKAAVDAQDKFASMCGKGLSEHKQVKPPLKKVLDQIATQIQPSLLS